MKIAYLFLFPLHMGGHFKSALAFVPFLVEAGHEILVIAPGAAPEVADAYRAAGARVELVPALGRWGYAPRPGVVRSVVALCKATGIELVHAQSVFAAGPANHVARRLRRPLVVTLPGGALGARTPPDWAPCVCYSGELIAALRTAGRPADAPTTLIRARLDTTLYAPGGAPPAWMEAHTIPTDGARVVMAMRLDADKRPWIDGLLALAEAVRASGAPIHIVVAGGGPLLPMLEERARALDADAAAPPILHLLGPLMDAADVRALYACADVVIGIGRGILEAMACGKPCVVMGRDGEGEPVTPERVDPLGRYNFSGRHFTEMDRARAPLGDMVHRLVADADERARLGAFARRYAVEQLDSAAGARALQAVYQAAPKRAATPWQSFTWAAADWVRHVRDRLAGRV